MDCVYFPLMCGYVCGVIASSERGIVVLTLKATK